MKHKPLDDLGELQRTVLETVWELGEASVHDVRERLNRTKQLAYTTVLSAMQKLEKASWLDHRAEGKSYVYFATQTREQASAGSVRRLVKRLFDGDALAMFGHLIRTSNLSEEDLQELRRMINDKRQEMRQ